jgi:hypothetical protein|tara:strand:- start:14968 stop:15456 length:489 start_codon:yes stop_codon:yes gene_type:complete
MSKKTQITILKRYEFKTCYNGSLEDPTYTELTTYFNGESVIAVFESETHEGESVIYRWDMTNGIIEEMSKYVLVILIRSGLTEDLMKLEDLYTRSKEIGGLHPNAIHPDDWGKMFHYPTSPNYLRILEEYRLANFRELDIRHDFGLSDQVIQEIEELEERLS